jgi:hypothetical protein
MGHADYHKSGEWNALCDRCGFKFKSSELQLEWDGFMVCKPCWEPRQPQDFVRGVPDRQSVPWTRSEPPDTFVAVNFPVPPPNF